VRTLTPTLSRKRERELAQTTQTSDLNDLPRLTNPLPQAGEGAGLDNPNL